MIELLESVEQWFWVRDGMFGGWEYNEHAVSGRRRGVRMPEEDFLVFEPVGGALDRMLSVLFLRKNLSLRDWDSFLSVYGIPSVFLVGPPNTGEAGGGGVPRDCGGDDFGWAGIPAAWE